MQFDLEKAVAVLGQGTGGPVDALGMAFGIPSCLVNMTKSALSVLPSPVLTGVSQIMEEARDNAGASINRVIKKTYLLNGIIEFDTDRGVLTFISGASQYGIDDNENQFLNSLNAITEAATFGASLWENIQDIESQVAEIAECIGGLSNAQRFANGNSALLKSGVDFDASALPPTASFELDKARLESASNFWNAANDQIGVVASILVGRRGNPELEPCFTDSTIFSGVDFCIQEDFDASAETTEQIFDLVFGPPKSKSGKFILTVDGLYYDYQNSSVYDISAIVPPEAIPMVGERYKFEHDPNLGGRGTAISVKSLNKFFNTIFDEDLIDDSDDMQLFYKEDHFLQFIINQRNKHIDDLKVELSSIEAIEGPTDALTINLKRSIFGQVEKHSRKINKRKKQIEIAIKAPTYYGPGAIFSIGDEIPINDFTFLSGVSMPVALEQQRKLVFNQGEVSGIVLPIKPKFVTSPERGDNIAMDHLVVPLVGVGSIITGSDYDQTSGTVLSLTDNITTDKLIAVYNFLETDIGTTHQSGKTAALNCATINRFGDAELVADSASDLFVSGLGFPLFKGINRFTSGGEASSVGSYMVLPDIADMRNLTYHEEGFSVDFWIHVPELGDQSSELGWGESNHSLFHKVVLACENTGGTFAYDDLNRVPPVFGTDSVRGMVMGFSRERQIARDLDSDSSPNSNDLSSGLVFYVAPTQSVNGDDVVFINNDTSSQCPNSPGWFKCSIDTSTIVNGVSFNDVSSNVMHVNLSVSPSRNEVSIYLDSSLMTTSAISEVFGVTPFSSPSIPSFFQDNSFDYGTSGPALNEYFTPWIVGGGFTDGDLPTGFMGQLQSFRSGLGGHLGSMKFYSKGLTSTEVQKNFDAQKGFFKNIDI